MIIIECPSGLTFEARRTWKLGDRKILLNRDIIRSGKLLHEMLDAVAGDVVDPGPYGFAAAKVEWDKVSHADITTAIIAVRRATKPVFAFNAKCEFCSTTMNLDIDLREVEAKLASEEGRNHLATQQPVTKKIQQQDPETEEPLGPVITLQLELLRGKHQRELMKYQKQEDDGGMVEVQNCMQLAGLQIGDEAPLFKEQHFAKIRAFYAQADWGFQDILDALIEELGGGVDIEVEVSCNKCGGEQTQVLPFNQDFFVPRGKQRSSFKVVS